MGVAAGCGCKEVSCICSFLQEYNIYYDYAVLLLISLLVHALINATSAGTRLY